MKFLQMKPASIFHLVINQELLWMVALIYQLLHLMKCMLALVHRNLVISQELFNILLLLPSYSSMVSMMVNNECARRCANINQISQLALHFAPSSVKTLTQLGKYIFTLL